MYTRDERYDLARKKIFSTTFFAYNLPFKQYYEKEALQTPEFLLSPYDSERDFWKKRFYNQKMNIDYKQTIVVFSETYDYYENLIDEMKFYYDSKTPLDNFRNSWGTKFKKQY
ncbi:MAG: hypothetical protein QXF12_00550 [Candidatus Aenigmatarchaeota archaeon]